MLYYAVTEFVLLDHFEGDSPLMLKTLFTKKKEKKKTIIVIQLDY